MAHGNPTTQCCKACKIYGTMPRFGSYECNKCENKTEKITKEEAESNSFEWIGWFN